MRGSDLRVAAHPNGACGELVDCRPCKFEGRQSMVCNRAQSQSPTRSKKQSAYYLPVNR
jgi:hypothetical protein